MCYAPFLSPMLVAVFVFLRFELNNRQTPVWQLGTLIVHGGQQGMLPSSGALLSGWWLAWKAVTSGTRVGNVFSRHSALTTSPPFPFRFSSYLAHRCSHVHQHHTHKYSKRLCLPAWTNPPAIYSERWRENVPTYGFCRKWEVGDSDQGHDLADLSVSCNSIWWRVGENREEKSGPETANHGLWWQEGA